MRSLLLFLFYMAQFSRLTCENFVFYTISYNNYQSEILNNITIGGVHYNIFSDYNFCKDNCKDNFNLSYPSSYDFPKIFFEIKNELIIKILLSNDNSKSRIVVEHAINNVIPEKDFQLDTVICWFTEDKVIPVQACVAWSTKKTYFIINIDDEKYIPADIYIKLGRGIGKVSVGKEIKKKSRTIYEISSNKIIRQTCFDYMGLLVREPLSFSMFSNSLSNMGGEKVIVRGPCLFQTSNTMLSTNILITHLSNSEKFNVPLRILNATKDTLYFIMPLVWHPGTYSFQFDYAGFHFEQEAEIYSLLESNRKNILSWKESQEMNNPQFSLESINLSFEGIYHSIFFNILNFSKFLNNKTPELKSYAFNCFNGLSNCSVNLLSNISLDIYNNIGLFSLNSLTGTIWSKPFSLIWLRAYFANNKGISKFEEEDCESFLTKPRNALKMIPYCPDQVKKAQLLLSTYRKISFPLDSLMLELNNQDCYVQISTSQAIKGRTCCYNINGNLIYGQDYYLRNSTIEGSYSWDYSPLMKPFEHFLYDRLPKMSCCSLIKNNALCSRYWESLNQVLISDESRDFAGNVFGDPHFMAFNELSKYSFLSRGEYWLLKGSNSKFNLQGRFYSKSELQSTLKAVAFSVNSNNIIITKGQNSVTLLDWKVWVNKNIITLPFSSEGTTIIPTQNSKGLLVYISILEHYFVHLEITGFYNIHKSDESMNLKIYLSNNFQDIVQGGLLGKIENQTSSSSLYWANSTESLPLNAQDLDYFNFGKSWKLQNIEESLFSYVTEWNEFQILNPQENFTEIKKSNSLNCESNTFCKIDEYYYHNEFLSLLTKETYEEREQYNKDVINAKYGKKNTCGHPKWSYIKLDSDRFEEGSLIHVDSCMDQTLNKKYPTLTLLCQNSTLMWKSTPKIDDEFCYKRPTPNSDEENNVKVIYIVIPLVVIILVIILVGSVIFYKKYRNSPSKVINTAFNSFSQDPLQNTTNINMDEVYDTWQPSAAEQEDHYGVYSHIKKPDSVKTP